MIRMVGVAVPEVLGVAFAVLLKRLAVLVEVPSVELDDQVVLGKVGVGLSAAQVEVELISGSSRSYLAMKALNRSSRPEAVGLA